MNGRYGLYVLLLTAVITVLLIYFPAFGDNVEEELYINPVSAHQISISTSIIFAFSFCLALVIIRAAVKFGMKRGASSREAFPESGDLLRLLFNSTPDLIYYKSAEGKYLMANDSAWSLVLSGEEKGDAALKRLDDDPFCKKLAERDDSIDEKAWEKGSTYRTTERLSMPDGTSLYYDIIKVPIFYNGGGRKGIVTLARDITTYKEAEKKLERKEKILRATLNATDNGILVVDNNRQVLEANDLYYNMWNIPWDVYSLNNETDNLKHIKKQLADPDDFEAWVNFTYEVPVVEHHYAKLLDGRIFDVFSTPLMGKGHMIGRVWSFRDMTARINAEKELQNSEERYRTLVELSHIAIFVCVDGKIEFSNMAGVKILGAESREDIYQRDISDFIKFDAKALTEKHINGTANGEVIMSSSEHKVLRLDGKSIDIEAVCSVVPYRGENAVMCMIMDISERKRNEELNRKIRENMKLVNETLEYDKVRTEFFANISHEVKTPLNIILGSLQLFELVLSGDNREEGFNKLVKYTSIMRQNCFRLLRMLNNLIYIAEIDSGFVAMHVRNYDLVKIVKSISSAVAGFIENKGVQFEVNIAPKSLKIACDAEKIKKVLLNILSNAVKFTEKGDRISVSLYSNGNNAYISVKDTGIGIPEEMKELVFQKFRQVDKSFTRRREGSGVGLSLAKALVEMHGGSIALNSEYGKGSEFVVAIPMRLAEGEEIAAASEDAANTCIDLVSIEFSDIY